MLKHQIGMARFMLNELEIIDCNNIIIPRVEGTNWYASDHHTHTGGHSQPLVTMYSSNYRVDLSLCVSETHNLNQIQMSCFSGQRYPVATGGRLLRPLAMHQLLTKQLIGCIQTDWINKGRQLHSACLEIIARSYVGEGLDSGGGLSLASLKVLTEKVTCRGS